MNTNRTIKQGVGSVRYLTVTAMLSAIAFVLMFFDFSIPMLIPNFIKMDLSDLPALVGSFSMGPLCGVLVCLIKNLLHLTITSTGGVGELSNFLLGASFVLPAGLVYKYKKSRGGALAGSLFGAVVMALVSIPSNYFFVYPFYYNFMSKEMILGAYQLIAAGFGFEINDILQCLIYFNAPFTLVKGLLSVVVTFLIYKHISPILKGTQR